MRCHYINLARSPERRAFMETQAERLGVEMIRLEAVDGQAIPDARYDRLVPEAPGRWRLARGEFACFLSHVEAWRIIAAGAEPFGAVFEDDVYLADSLAPLLAGAAWIPAEAAVVKLTANSHRFTLAEAPVARVGSRALHRILSPTIDCGAYIIAASHARRLCAEIAVHTMPVDRFLMDPARGGVLYQLMPGGAVQSKFADFDFLDEDDSTSLIQREKPKRARRSVVETLSGEMGNLRAKVLRPLLLPVRQIFRPKSRRVMITAVPFRR
jgi:glycosyl transferase family 25